MRGVLPEKRPYKFYMPDGSVGTVGDISSLNYEDQKHRDARYQAYLQAESYFERQWRNDELSKTDWMLLPDATYEKQDLAGSVRLDQVMDYRAQLRAYNLTTDPRPLRPSWLKDEER